MGQVVEWVLIFLAIASLWPWILGYRGGWLYPVWAAALVAMIWVLVRRVNRVRGAR